MSLDICDSLSGLAYFCVIFTKIKLLTSGIDFENQLYDAIKEIESSSKVNSILVRAKGRFTGGPYFVR